MSTLTALSETTTAEMYNCGVLIERGDDYFGSLFLTEGEMDGLVQAWLERTVKETITSKILCPMYAGSWGYPACGVEVGDRVSLWESYSSDPRERAVKDEDGGFVVVMVHHLYGGGDRSHWSDPEITVSVREL